MTVVLDVHPKGVDPVSCGPSRPTGVGGTGGPSKDTPTPPASCTPSGITHRWVELVVREPVCLTAHPRRVCALDTGSVTCPMDQTSRRVPNLTHRRIFPNVSTHDPESHDPNPTTRTPRSRLNPDGPDTHGPTTHGPTTHGPD